MKAVIYQTKPPYVLSLDESEHPIPKSDDLVIEVKACGVNRADLLQRRGLYPPPKGVTTILGLEISGVVVETGKDVTHYKEGDEIFGLIPGGGYAQYALINEKMALRKPQWLSFIEAAAIPEAFLTAWQVLHWLAKLKPEEIILIHAAAGGVGTAALQLAKEAGAYVIATASAGKHALCKQLGADFTIDYTSESFQDEVLEITNGKGVNVIVDFIGADFLSSNLNAMALDARLIVLGLLSGVKSVINLGEVLVRRVQIIGSTLRNRSLDYQSGLTSEFWSHCSNLFQMKKLKPVIDSIYTIDEVEKAHERMNQNLNKGKIILTILQ